MSPLPAITRPLARGVIAAALVVLGMLFLAAAASAQIIADDGFRPPVDGFSFENYGPGHAGLSANEVRTLFGPRVCKFLTASGECVLTPPAEAWREQTNAGMDGGHCQGFSVMSLLLFRKLYPAFDSGSTFSLRLHGNVRLQRAIAYGFAFQDLPAVVDASVTKTTPDRVLRFLIAALRQPHGETYGMGIYKANRTGGHEITPYAVDDLGGGHFDVLLYDNNFPGVTRRLHIDTGTDSWSYQASTNPKQQSSLYRGDARTKTLELDPTSPGLGEHPCPFCGAPPRDVYNELQLEGSPSNHAHLLIVDARGRRIGYVRGRLISTIPGARALFPRAIADSSEKQEPIYRVPAKLNLTVTIDGRGLRMPDTERVSLIGPDHDVVIESLRIRPGELNRFAVSATARSMSYRSAPGQRESPTFDMSVDRARTDYRILVRALALNPGSTVRIAANRRSGTLTFRDLGTRPQTFRISIARYTASRVMVVLRRTVRLRAGAKGLIRYANPRP